MDNEKIRMNQLYQQIPLNLNRIMSQFNRDFNEYYNELQRYRVPRYLSRNIIRTIVSYIITNEESYTGSNQQMVDQIFSDIQISYPIIFYLLRAYRAPDNRINQIIRDIISIVLGRGEEQPSPPAPTPSGSRWSDWEDLGGILTQDNRSYYKIGFQQTVNLTGYQASCNSSLMINIK